MTFDTVKLTLKKQTTVSLLLLILDTLRGIDIRLWG